jgi:hypothetical protein
MIIRGDQEGSAYSYALGLQHSEGADPPRPVE